jgi:hypothetical protein
MSDFPVYRSLRQRHDEDERSAIAILGKDSDRVIGLNCVYPRKLAQRMLPVLKSMFLNVRVIDDLHE